MIDLGKHAGRIRRDKYLAEVTNCRGAAGSSGINCTDLPTDSKCRTSPAKQIETENTHEAKGAHLSKDTRYCCPQLSLSLAHCRCRGWEFVPCIHCSVAIL